MSAYNQYFLLISHTALCKQAYMKICMWFITVSVGIQIGIIGTINFALINILRKTFIMYDQKPWYKLDIVS